MKKKLGKDFSHRKAMISNQVSSLILNDYIVTTEAKAKVCKAQFDRVISLAKKNTNSTRSKVESLVRNSEAVKKIYDVYIKRFENTKFGFCEIYKLGKRRGDDSKMCKIVICGSQAVRTKKKAKIKKRSVAVVEKEAKTKDEKRKVTAKDGVLSKVKGISKIFSKSTIKDQNVKPKKFETKTRSGI